MPLRRSAQIQPLYSPALFDKCPAMRTAAQYWSQYGRNMPNEKNRDSHAHDQVWKRASTLSSPWQHIAHWRQSWLMHFDECESNSRPDLLQALERIINYSSNLVKIFVSSRNDQDIVCHLNNCPNLEIEAAKNQEDIVKFVHSEVQRRISRKELLLGKPPLSLISSITERLCGGADGMLVVFLSRCCIYYPSES